ncbi:hypothetical protein LTS14_005476 [Recurvomyces mirabilis]|uniref:uncharacterized protein n=1 Tax=Recurvomyces mirabilis TaxID=574656 RepID=UPI002DE06111|nr:hypothetical protein LTS14_005476 [Recurvomyces mirabilis]
MASLFFPNFGGLFQASILVVNAIAILSEDRFLARTTTVGWGTSQQSEPSFGGGMQDNTSVKAKMINLISSVRTLMRIPLIFLNLLIIVWAIAFG